MSTAQPAAMSGAPPRRLRVGRLDLLGLAAFTLIAVALGMGLLYAPTELIQGEPQRIFYVHLPMAIASYIAFLVVAVGGALYLWKRRPGYDIAARSAAEIGFLFITLVIISGGLWGQATWGTFWQWEPRLTFTFVLWLIFLGYIMLRQAARDRDQAARFASVLGIIGFADVPLIFSSVYLWRGIHPEPATMPQPMFITFLIATVGFLALFAYLLALRTRWDKTRDRIDEMRAALED